MTFRRIWKLNLLLFCTIASGCNRSGLNLVPVEGVVKFKGQPVVGAGVMFVQAHGLPAMALTDESGKFKLKTANQKGAQLGDYQVTVSKSKTTAVPQQNGFPIYKTEHFIPEKYAKLTTSGLTANVGNQSNYFEFELTEK